MPDPGEVRHPSGGCDAPRVCERCKWWAPGVVDPVGAEPGAFGFCNDYNASALMTTADRRSRVLTGRGFGCRFWEQRAPKETQSPCETEEKG